MSKFSELMKIKSWRIWFKGLLSAAINGFALGGTLVLVNPKAFNFTADGLWNLFTVCVTACIYRILTYLKDVPMPGLEEEAIESLPKTG